MSVDKLVVWYPTREHFEAAVGLESKQWAKSQPGPGNILPEVIQTIESGLKKLTNPKYTPEQVLEAVRQVLVQIRKRQKQAQAAAQVLELLNAAAGAICNDPECPVHGKKPTGA